MGAITARWTVQEAAVMALSAGVDIVMISDPQQASAVLDRIEQSIEAGELKRGSVFSSIHRVLALKNLDPCQILDTIDRETN